MPALTYHVDLNSRDYAAITLRAAGGWRKERRLAVAVGLALFLTEFLALSLPWFLALAIALFAGIVGGALVLIGVRGKSVWALRRRFIAHPFDQLLGPMTITLDDEGIRAGRDEFSVWYRWKAILSAVVTPSFVFVQTVHTSLFGIPRRFIGNMDELRVFLSRHVPLFDGDDQRLWTPSTVVRAPVRGEPATNAFSELFAVMHAAGTRPEAVERLTMLLRDTRESAPLVSALRVSVSDACLAVLNEQLAAGEAACSFCAKPRETVFWLVQGATASICEECTAGAAATIAYGQALRNGKGSLAWLWWRVRHSRVFRAFDVRQIMGGA